MNRGFFVVNLMYYLINMETIEYYWVKSNDEWTIAECTLKDGIIIEYLFFGNDETLYPYEVHVEFGDKIEIPEKYKS